MGFSDLIGVLFAGWFSIYLFHQFFGGVLSLFPKPEENEDVKVIVVHNTRA